MRTTRITPDFSTISFDGEELFGFSIVDGDPIDGVEACLATTGTCLCDACVDRWITGATAAQAAYDDVAEAAANKVLAELDEEEAQASDSQTIAVDPELEELLDLADAQDEAAAVAAFASEQAEFAAGWREVFGLARPGRLIANRDDVDAVMAAARKVAADSDSIVEATEKGMSLAGNGWTFYFTVEGALLVGVKVPLSARAEDAQRKLLASARLGRNLATRSDAARLGAIATKVVSDPTSVVSTSDKGVKVTGSVWSFTYTSDGNILVWAERNTPAKARKTNPRRNGNARKANKETAPEAAPVSTKRRRRGRR
jgi:hypothetical protein